MCITRLLDVDPFSGGMVGGRKLRPLFRILKVLKLALL